MGLPEGFSLRTRATDAASRLSSVYEGRVRRMIIVTAGTLAIGATAGMMLEQRFGATVTSWCRRQLWRWRHSRRR
jgi:hypothetical protein